MEARRHIFYFLFTANNTKVIPGLLVFRIMMYNYTHFVSCFHSLTFKC